MFLDIENIPIEHLQGKIIEKYKSRLKCEENFIQDNSFHIACYIDGAKQFTSLFFVTDEQMKPFLCFKVNSYIDRCAISATGKYAAIKTNRNPDNNADSGTLIILDLQNATEISRPKTETPWVNGSLLCIDEHSHTFSISYGNVKVRYAFDGKIADTAQLWEYYEQPDVSPYDVNNWIYRSLDNFETLSDEQQESIAACLERLNGSIEMSHYQLSLTYKKYGDKLAQTGDAVRAITAYETGLTLNSKLPIKRSLSKLKKNNPMLKVPKPIVPSLERERALEDDNYILPSTYEPARQNAEKAQAQKVFEDERASALYDALKEIGYSFIDSLKSDAYRFAESIPNLNSMSDDEFNSLFKKLCDRLDSIAKEEVRKSSERIIRSHSEDDVLSIRQKIILNLHSMIQSYIGISLESKDI